MEDGDDMGMLVPPSLKDFSSVKSVEVGASCSVFPLDQNGILI